MLRSDIAWAGTDKDNEEDEENKEDKGDGETDTNMGAECKQERSDSTEEDRWMNVDVPTLAGGVLPAGTLWHLAVLAR